MLRAGICDLGTCDLEIGCPAGSMRPVSGGRPAPRPPARNCLARPGERANPGRARWARRPACDQQWIAGPLHVPLEGPLTCGATAGDGQPQLRPGGGARCRHGRREFPAPGARRFRPAAVAFPARPAPRVSPPERRGVSPSARGVSSRVSPEGAPGCCAFPVWPSLWARRRSPPPSSQACDPFGGRPHATG
jgi:hypothetical protein